MNFLQQIPHRGKRLRSGPSLKWNRIPTWVFNILWTDEAHFSLHGDVNNHNCRIWATSNPRRPTKRRKMLAENSKKRRQKSSKTVDEKTVIKVPCKYCTNCTLVIKQHHSMGYSTKMELLCESCHESYGSVFSSFQEEAKNSHDINSKLVSAFLSIGRGHAALETFSSVLNMPTMDRKTFAKCMHNLSVKNKEVKKKMLEMSRQAAREAHVKVDASLQNQEIIDVSVSYDGTWQK
ncbi:uncharacterized protein TNCV_3211421 [Trichonephila clavipes]|uniref:Mutator-like transposase domain-containing protein n=2 Tax=Trichonephila clavipes TaxID=2585209 RepID=A0A8X6S2W7_TRICX|nr:uncharacterized protein TNCV_3211421 [Trichonephila clavipes]